MNLCFASVVGAANAFTPKETCISDENCTSPCNGQQLWAVTWNVWFGSTEQESRQSALLKIIATENPDVIGLQEVTPVFFEGLRAHSFIAQYDISPNHIEAYGSLLLVRKSLGASFREVRFPGHMGRSLLWAELSAAPDVAIGTVHLESLDARAVRLKQLQITANVLAPFTGAAFFGDFNFDATRTWGEWRRHDLSIFYEAGGLDLENTAAMKILSTYADAWAWLYPGDLGYTFDGTANPVIIKDPKEQMSYDRIMTRGLLVPHSASRLGREPIDASGIRPSDHYGLVVDMCLDR